jgi:hypothetical protein
MYNIAANTAKMLEHYAVPQAEENQACPSIYKAPIAPKMCLKRFKN